MYDAESGRAKSALLHRYIAKYGVRSISAIADVPDTELDSAEIEAIREHRSWKAENPLGLNLLSGGGCHGRHSPETKARIGRAGTGRRVSEETRRRQSEALRRRYTDPAERTKTALASRRFLARPDVKEKIRIAGTGRRHTTSARAKMSAAHTGREKSAAHLANISEAKRKLSRAQAEAVRFLVAAGATKTAIASWFDVSDATINHVMYRKGAYKLTA